jgi:AbrB family looped-hinge helix DNA binding protein
MMKLFRNTERENMKISERGQVTIPKVLRKRFGLHKDIEIELIPVKEGLLIQKRSRGRHPVDLVFGILKRPSDTDRYIEEVRGR